MQKILFYTLFFLLLGNTLSAQSIQVEVEPFCTGAAPGTINTLNSTGTSGSPARHTFTGTFVAIPDMDEIQVAWNSGLNRWEFRWDDDGNLGNGYEELLYYNTTNTAPLAPALGLGTWVATNVLVCSDPLLQFNGTGTTSSVPVELTSFRATAISAGSRLTWTTATETDNAGFEVQRSADSEKWTALSFVRGKGNSVIASTYSYLDVQPLSGIAYYRLKQLDNNGTFKFSSIVTVSRSNGADASEVFISPNPTASTLQVQNGSGLVTVYDILGRSVLETSLENTNTVDVSNLTAGQYILFIQNTNGQTASKRFVKE